MPLRLLAIDIGAESGRGVVGRFDGQRLHLEEVRRFPNVPVRLNRTLYWDFLRIFNDVEITIAEAGKPASVGIDTWGVDFGLLDARGRLLANPVHYRDQRTAGLLERLPKDEAYAQTGIQFLEINTLVQLMSMVEHHDPDLDRADRLLLMPDLLHHFLCGSGVSEFTNATTTQCFDPRRGTWADDLLERLYIPRRIFPDVVQPGTVLGVVGDAQVVAPATHDTASAVAAMPLDQETVFLSSGTWSLIGTEVDAPLINELARTANLTNEGGINGTTRLLKNVMGLWLLQQARSALSLSYPELIDLAGAARPHSAFIDPDDPRFLRATPADLSQLVGDYCAETRQPPPQDAGALIRVLLESLALKYAVVVRELECVTGRTFSRVYVVGGGVNNQLLCQLTADASGLTVLAGPVESTALGNLVVQSVALRELASVAEGRSLIAQSFPTQRYEPRVDLNWTAARERFNDLLSPEDT